MPELKKRRKSRKLLKITAALGLFFVFLGAVFYGLIFASLFKINKVVVSGAAELGDEIREIANRELTQKIFNKIPVNNYFLLPEKEISGAILNKFPEIKAVDAKISLREHGLNLNLKLRQPSVIWCRVLAEDDEAVVSSSTDVAKVSSEKQDMPEAEKCFFVDGEGFAFKSAPVLSGGIAPIVYEQIAYPVRDVASNGISDLKLKDTVSDSKALRFILETKKQLDAVNLELTDFVISGKTLGDLEILSPDGWKIILNIGGSPAVQISALKRVLEEEIKEKRPQLEYVDLRVENRVYYKLR